jgi:hypothetical protein
MGERSEKGSGVKFLLALFVLCIPICASAQTKDDLLLRQLTELQKSVDRLNQLTERLVKVEAEVQTLRQELARLASKNSSAEPSVREPAIREERQATGIVEFQNNWTQEVTVTLGRPDAAEEVFVLSAGKSVQKIITPGKFGYWVHGVHRDWQHREVLSKQTYYVKIGETMEAMNGR